MAGKRYCGKYPKSVALTLRMTEFLNGRGHVVHGDSAFASVATCTALLEHSTYFSGLLKTAHKEFPRKYGLEHSTYFSGLLKTAHKEFPRKYGLEHSTYFSGLLKTAHKEFPRKYGL